MTGINSKLSLILTKAKENKPLLCILFFLFYITGLSAFYYHGGVIISTVVILFLILLFSLSFIKKTFFSVISPVFIFCLFLIFLSGYLNAKLHFVNSDEFSEIDYLKNVELTGVIKNIPSCNTTKAVCKFPFKVQNAFIKGKNYPVKNAVVLASVNNKNNDFNLKFGDRVKLKGTISTPLSASNPSQFDYAEFLARRGILKTFYVNGGGYEFLNSPRNDSSSPLRLKFMRYMNDLRDGVILKHSKYIESPKLEILGGVVFGDDAVNPPDDVKGSFINSGLSHLLAASGLNVALILSMWLCIIYFINIPYRIKIISGIFIILLYTVMTGFPPSIVRASVMFLLILAGKLLYREANGISLIFAAGLLILTFKPEFLLDVGFQLSFLVTLGLIISVPCVNGIFSDKEKGYIRKIKNFNKPIKSFLLIFSPVSLICVILIPLVAQLWAAPLQAFYFNTFSLYSVIANIAVVPFIGVVSFLGFISTAFCFIPYISDIVLPFFDFILNFIIQIVLNISNFFSSLQFSVIKVPSPSFCSILTYYIFIILLFVSIKFLFKKKILNYSLLILFPLLILQNLNFKNSDFEIIFFDVLNADNCLIKTSDNKYIMIDTGRYILGGNSSAKAVTLEYFYDKNIKEIDTLIVTHYDSDHSGGLVDILKEIKVKNLIISNPVCDSKNSCLIKEYFDLNNVKYIPPYSKQHFTFDSDTEVVNYVPDIKTKNIKNDSSTVTFIRYGGYKFLFLADIGIKAFHDIEKFMPPDIDILKASHHGAKNTVDDKMLKRLRPKYSVISTGKNPYGHPNPKTVYELKKYSTVLSTKDSGAIKFKIGKKDNKIKVFHFFKKEKKFKKINN